MGIFAQMIDICLNNAWTIYRRHCGQNNTKKTLSLKQFRCDVFLALSQKTRVEINTPQITEKIRKPVVSRPVDDVRYDGMGHLPGIEERGRCRLCKTGYSTTMW